MKRLVLTMLLAMTLAGGLATAGCGPSKKPPKETDVSRIPPDTLAAFRRSQPNAVILNAREVDGGKWQLLVSTPRREKKTYLYSPQGDLLKKW